MEEEADRFWGKWGIQLLLVLLVVGGAYGIEVFDGSGKHPHKFLEHLSMAIAVAGVIGIVIEFTLHRELAKNVFRAAIGYLLPEELRGELRWIYGLPFLCENHVQIVTITPIEKTTLVTVRHEVTRVLKNITDKTQTFQPGLGMEEWLYDGHPSKIISYTCQKHNEPISEISPSILFRKGAVFI